MGIVLGIMVTVLAVWGAISSTSDEELKNMSNKRPEEKRKRKTGKKEYTGGPPPCRGFYD